MKRKTNSIKRRRDIFHRALMATNKVAVVSLSRGTQHLVCLRTLKEIRASKQVMDALIMTTYKWTVFIGGFCQAQDGEQYAKVSGFSTKEFYLSNTLKDVLAEEWESLCNKCNHLHFIGSGWVAIPTITNISREDIKTIFVNLDVWSTPDAE